VCSAGFGSIAPRRRTSSNAARSGRVVRRRICVARTRGRRMTSGWAQRRAYSVSSIPHAHGSGLTPKLSCKRSTCQAAHQFTRLSALQPINRNASFDLALGNCSDTLAGAAVPRPMRRNLSARGACSPGELRVAMRALRMGVEGVKSAPAAIGTTYPLRADEWREAACRARDIVAAFREVDDSIYSLHHRTSMRPANAN